MTLVWEWVDSNHQSQKGKVLQTFRLPITGYIPTKKHSTR